MLLRVPRQAFLPVHLRCLAALLGGVGALFGYVKLRNDGVMHNPGDSFGGSRGVGGDAFPSSSAKTTNPDSPGNLARSYQDTGTGSASEVCRQLHQHRQWSKAKTRKARKNRP